ncbi:hypothetical protein JOF55_004876 [Haloactinomyces albus]|uniref:Uncharacterized protein n=1 Tax=Haloactinomyces albus TaxID=1352928 RepID=A0AAE4CQZ9_9ACTN|nr:hypothetical protein [Haloactinomyces albus]
MQLVDGIEHAVDPGQTAMFDGDTPQTCRGAGAETCP